METNIDLYNKIVKYSAVTCILQVSTNKKSSLRTLLMHYDYNIDLLGELQLTDSIIKNIVKEVSDQIRVYCTILHLGCTIVQKALQTLKSSQILNHWSSPQGTLIRYNN